jgi:arylsulfatase A-like enzyme
VLDLTLRLDVLLGQLFDALDRELGRDGWAVVLSSDHGSTPLVERARVAHSRRIPTDEIRLVAESALGTYGEGPWIAAVSSNNVYFTPKLAKLSVTDRTAVLETAAKAIAAVPGVAAAGRNDRLDGACEPRTGLDRAICFSIVGGESGELYVLARQGSLISEYTAGTGHDAPFEDNRLVPVYVKAPGLRPRVGKASTLQIAPTISALLGVPAPEAATARPLFDLPAR